MSLIELKNINFHYDEKSSNGKFQLSNINLSVESGEFITLLGPNGSGKSTLLKIILGLLKPVSGDILLKEKKITTYNRKNIASLLGFVPQSSFSIYPFSIYEIVMMGRTPYLNLWGYEKEIDHSKVIDALKFVGIEHLKNKGINEVSGGEAQRAFIARALVQEPKVLLLDEPNAHLDLEHQVSIFNMLQKLNKEQGITVLVVSHDLNLAGCYGNRAVLMQNGTIYLDDEKSNILTEENIKKIFKVNSHIYYNSEENIINIAIYPQDKKGN